MGEIMVDREGDRRHFKTLDVPIVHMVLNEQLEITGINAKGIKEFESEEDSYIGRSILKVVSELDRALVQDYFNVMTALDQFERELMCRCLTKAGKQKWYSINIRRNITSKGLTYDLFFTNRTQLKLVEQFLKSEKQILEALAKNWSLKDTLDLLARTVEGITGGHCTIFKIDQASELIIPMAMPSLSNEYLRWMTGLKIGLAQSNEESPFFNRRARVVMDIETDPLWERYRGDALALGLKSCWSNPIFNFKSQVVGGLIIYHQDKRSPSPNVIKAMEFFTHLAELAIRHNEVRASEIWASEEKYRMIAENTSDLIVLFDREGRVVYASPSLEDFFGIAPHVLLEKNIKDKTFPLDFGNKKKLRQIVRSKRKRNVTIEVILENDEVQTLEINSSPILNSEGEIENSVLVCRDITERQRAQQEIERLHHQNDSILHAAGDGIFGVDLKGNIMFCNHTAAFIFGYDKEELIGKPLQNTLLKSKEDEGSHLKNLIHIIRSIKEKRTIHSDREVFRHRNGFVFPVEFIAAPILEKEKGKVTGTVVTFRDITERKKEEEWRQKQELKFRNQQQILQRLSVHVHDHSFEDAIQAITEHSGNVLKVERTSVWLYSKEDQLYRCQDLYHRNENYHTQGIRLLQKDIKRFLDALKEDRVFIFEGGDPRIIEIQDKYMEPKGIQSLLVAPIYSGKHINGFVMFAIKEDQKAWDYDEQNFATAVADLIHLLLEKDERLKAEDLLRKTEKLSLVGELAAGVAHEIRNPLTSLKGFLQLMREKNQSAEDLPFYNIMLSEIDRINFISGELLLLAKPQATIFSQVDLDKVCQEVQSLFSTEASLHNIQFDYKNRIGRSQKSIVKGDPDQIKQVLVNVMKNGMEAMETGGIIEIWLDLKADNHYYLEIKDCGKGMSEERLRRLGEPFYTTKEKGTGLGLMVSYRIIEAHKGAITVESQVNKGTTVLISLPKLMEKASENE